MWTYLVIDSNSSPAAVAFHSAISDLRRRSLCYNLTDAIIII